MQNEVQSMVDDAYQKWWMRQVIVQECENGRRDPMKLWDWWHAHWLCQMHDWYHDIPKQYLYWDWEFQNTYCSEKIKWWTKFYGPDRPLYADKAKTIFLWICKDVVKSRFKLVDQNA